MRWPPIALKVDGRGIELRGNPGDYAADKARIFWNSHPDGEIEWFTHEVYIPRCEIQIEADARIEGCELGQQWSKVFLRTVQKETWT